MLVLLKHIRTVTQTFSFRRQVSVDIQKMKWVGLKATFVHIQAKLGQDNILRMGRWVKLHCPPDTGFEIQTLEFWVWARYLSVTDAPQNTEFHEWMGEKHFSFFLTAETGKPNPNSSVKGSGANHYPRALAQCTHKKITRDLQWFARYVTAVSN